MPFFNVLPNETRLPQEGQSIAYLKADNWDDWFEFETLYVLFVYDADGARHNVGGVKIGQFGMDKGQRSPNLPASFDSLNADGNEYFSLGQDESYYVRLNSLGPQLRDQVLDALGDVAFNLELFNAALRERVTGTSLLRSVDRSTVRGQFHRIAHGGARLTRYSFSYAAPRRRRSRIEPLRLSFEVEPESFPPMNVHALIGRNGVGKTTILNNMARAIAEEDAEAREVGTFSGDDELEEEASDIFTSLVSVTFSAFDPFEPIPNKRDKSSGFRYSYVGLKQISAKRSEKPKPPKSLEALTRDFIASVLLCRIGERAQRWKNALQVLESDPIFRDASVTELASEDFDDDDAVKEEARRLFRNFSSGHKIVLLTITRLVEVVEEQTLALIDEPEAHLHPPLLSAFTRALSDLMVDRNGVAIVATHSPVILQEVPAECVWMVRRSGATARADRPGIETFGENVGVLTREVFGLEVTHSGFHKMLIDAIDQRPNFRSVIRKFGGKLGGEATSIVRARIAAIENEEDEAEDD